MFSLFQGTGWWAHVYQGHRDIKPREENPRIFHSDCLHLCCLLPRHSSLHLLHLCLEQPQYSSILLVHEGATKVEVGWCRRLELYCSCFLSCWHVIFNLLPMFQVMDNDHDMRVSIVELKAVLSNSTQGRNKMNSTLFRNLVEKSEKVKFFNKIHHHHRDRIPVTSRTLFPWRRLADLSSLDWSW